MLHEVPVGSIGFTAKGYLRDEEIGLPLHNDSRQDFRSARLGVERTRDFAS